MSDSKVAFEAVEEISSITEEQAASSEEIPTITEKLMDTIEAISFTMEDMGEKIKNQSKSFSEFKVLSGQLLSMAEELNKNVEINN